MVGPRDLDEEVEDESLQEEGDDAGRVNDEGGDDSQTGQESQAFEAEERLDRRGQRDDRIREELRAEREHRTRVEAELQALRQQAEQARQPQFREETDQEFLARVAVMEPEQRMEAKYERAMRFHNRQLALQTFAMADRADKVAFDSKAQSDPDRARLAKRVEEVLAIERRKGRDFDRETVYKYILGEEREVRKSRGSPAPAQRRGQDNIQRQQARTTGGRGDQGRDERPRRYSANDMSPEAVRQRLEAPDAFI